MTVSTVNSICVNDVFASRCFAEYCSSRAVPTIEQSEYLNTIGSRLLPGIDIMWTGPKVISKRLTVEHIDEITAALRRPPVIWDNIHANDYDQKRLFLGPYEGRSSVLIPRLRGVMTNPNCEFEANFIAMHTLAQWARSYRGESTEAEALLSTFFVAMNVICLCCNCGAFIGVYVSLLACEMRLQELPLKHNTCTFCLLFSRF